MTFIEKIRKITKENENYNQNKIQKQVQETEKKIRKNIENNAKKGINFLSGEYHISQKNEYESVLDILSKEGFKIEFNKYDVYNPSYTIFW